MYQNISQDRQYILIALSNDRQAVQEKKGEILLPLNEAGNLISGFEMVGGFVDFSVAKATEPFNPVSRRKGGG
jgi:hypothetical protein